jgi:phosphomannomutase
LKYLSEVDLPIKRGTFIEFRKSMINISPIGRNCSHSERDDFDNYDKHEKVREKMIKNLREQFPDLELTYSIGGQISFDVFPHGWNKTYCLKFIENEEIHFFGDKTMPGGNDYEIFIDKRVTGHTVATYKDTMKIVNQIYFPHNI